MVYPNGVDYDAVQDPVRRRLSKATVFVLDRDTVAMAANVALSKPSSILSALPFARLPYPLTWIEWTADDIRSAMAELGSPNIKPFAHSSARIERVGFLLEELPAKAGEARRLLVEYYYRESAPGHSKSIPEMAPIRFVITMPDDLPDPADAQGDMGAGTPADAREASATGRVRDHIILLQKNPYEQACSDLLHDAYRSELHPAIGPIIDAMSEMMGLSKTMKIIADKTREAGLQSLILLPSLILLNARNAVESQLVPAPEKLNKARLKRRQHPLVEHRVVKLKLSKSQGARSEQGSDSSRHIRGTLVRGHFKTRRTGIYWWNAYARAGYGAVTKSYLVTP